MPFRPPIHRLLGALAVLAATASGAAEGLDLDQALLTGDIVEGLDSSVA